MILAPSFLPELNKLPDRVVSMAAAVDDVSTSLAKAGETHTCSLDARSEADLAARGQAMETKYTKIESSVPIIPQIIKGKLTPSLSEYYIHRGIPYITTQVNLKIRLF